MDTNAELNNTEDVTEESIEETKKTVSLDKYKKLQDKLEMKLRVIEGLNKTVDEKNKLINSLEDSLKIQEKEKARLQENFKKQQEKILKDANEYIKIEVAKATQDVKNLIEESEYTKNLVGDAFALVDILKETKHKETEALERVIELFKTNVVSIEPIHKKGDE